METAIKGELARERERERKIFVDIEYMYVHINIYLRYSGCIVEMGYTGFHGGYTAII